MARIASIGNGTRVQLSPVLEIRSLTKRFGEFVAVDDVSFEVERGTFVSLLGPSGSGKTTILKAIAGFEVPSTGDIFLDGERINDKQAHQRDVATVFQQYALFPHMNVFDNIAFGLECRRVPAEEVRRKVSEILELTQLTGKDSRRIQTLSGGEQQRVALARSLVTNPSLLLLDEPLGALDLKLRREMALELKRLHDHLGMTFLYVTHDQEEALSMSDRVIVMHAGRIRQTGTPSEVYWWPRSTFVADFLGGANVLSGTVVQSNRGLLHISLKGPNSETQVTIRGDEAHPGDVVSFAVRGEKIALEGEAAHKDNQLQVILEDIRFYGPLTEFDFRLDSGQSLRVRSGGVANGITHARGQVTQVGWNAADAGMISED